MHVTAETVTLSSERFSLDADAPRFDGCHISTIVNYMEQKQYGAREESATQAGFSCGFLFERLMAREAAVAEASSAAIVRVGEIIWCVQCRTPYFVWKLWLRHYGETGHTGLAATPDAALVKSGILKEFKLTKRSMRSAGADDRIVSNGDGGGDDDGDGSIQPEHPKYEHISIGFWGWVVALKTYAFMLSTFDAHHEVVFVNGDYGLTTRDYLIRRYTYRFERGELRENFDMVIGNGYDAGLLVDEV